AIRARRSSWTVRASAFGKPGIRATGPKYSSSPAAVASNTARAAIASDPAWLPATRGAPVTTVAAARAARSVRLKRLRPKVAPARDATSRARSSAAPRDAPTIRISEAGGRDERKARARSSRADAEVDVTMRTIEHQPPGRHAGNSESAAPRRRRIDD